MLRYPVRLSKDESPWRILGLVNLSLALILVGGCAAPYSWRKEIPKIDNAPDSEASNDKSIASANKSQQPPTETNPPQETPAETPLESRPTIPPDSMADLEAIGQFDPAEKESLLADYDKMKPAIWQGLVKQRRALLAYKQKSGERANPTSLTEEPRNSSTRENLPSENNHDFSEARHAPEIATRNDDEPNAQYQANAMRQSVTPATQVTEAAREVAPPENMPSDSNSQNPNTPNTPNLSKSQQPHQQALRQAPHQRPLTVTPNLLDTPESREAMKRQFVQMQMNQQMMNQQMQSGANPLRSGGFPSGMSQAMGMPSQLPGMATPLVSSQLASAQTTLATAPQMSAQNRNDQPVSANRVSAQTSEQQLNLAIKTLEKEVQKLPDSPEKTKRYAALRLLYLAANRPNDAMQPPPGVSPESQDYWAPQIFGLSTILDSGQITDEKRRAATAKRHLTKAVNKLGELGTLTLNNLALCRKVTSFGVYDSFDPLEFAPGAEVLLYAEVDNFLSEPHEKGFHTSLKSSYLILDHRGEEVAEDEFPVVDDYCRQVRRDFFVRCFVRLPRNLPDGKYTLQLFVEDIKSQKLGQTSIEFTIQEPTAQ